MMEIVHGGWLKKSPPDKRIWRAKWRRRWFVLRQSGQIPGQYVLEYFTDQSCKKLKGHIDLDQCEQVDAGVTLEAAGRGNSSSSNNNNALVFDIRTPKRIYYLVADSEADMNKWVDCICAVCGLKMHLEEDYDVQLSESMGPATTVVVVSEPIPMLAGDDLSIKEDSRSLTSLSTCGTSGPYIPISECHSGTNGFLLNSMHSLQDEGEVFPSHIPPPPPKHSEHKKNRNSTEFYDYPRHLHPRELDETRSSPDLTHEDEFYILPVPKRSPQQRSEDWGTTTSTPSGPPKVNWETYPRNEADVMIYENRRMSSGGLEDAYDHPNISYATTATEDKLARLSLTDSGVEVQQRSLSSSPQDSLVEASNLSLARTLQKAPPPRPPKPKPQRLIESLQQHGTSKNNYDNIDECEKMLYDVPPSAQGVFLSKNLPANAFAYLKDDAIDHIPFVPTKTGAAAVADDMYDFPRPLHDDHQLGATPPAPSTDATWRRRHAYTNAPSTTVQDGAVTDQDEYLTMDANHRRHSSEVYTDMSGEQQRILLNSVYSNVPSPKYDNVFVLEVPPAVDRKLKPGRRVEENSATSPAPSPTDFKPETSRPSNPPVVNRTLKPKRMTEESSGAIHPTTITLSPSQPTFSHQIHKKRSFRKPKEIPSPNVAAAHRRLLGTPPNATGTNNGGPAFPAKSDRSSSDDDQSSSSSSRRNSSNDDHAATATLKPHLKSPSQFSFGKRHEPEIQYLDLDLESDASPKSPEKLTTNTVYKTVDFVKTKAFNEMRQNVEECYRKSQ